MTFFERYETLCTERGLKPQTQEILDVAGVKSPSVSGWKTGSQPKADVLCRLAKYFDVTTDYLLGLSEVRNPHTLPTLTEQEMVLLSAFRAATVEGQFHIIQVCMNERDAAVAEKGESVSVG